jgi:phage terminase large subunit-like protein
LELDAELPVFVGVDMALKHDSIAVVVAQPRGDGRVVCRAKIWHPDSAMDVAAVEAHIRGLARDWRVVEVAYDPAFFQRSAEVLADDGLPMVEFPQSTARMVPACGTLYEMIVGGKLAINNDPMFIDQLLSPAQRQTDSGWRLSKGKSKRKIDAAIATVIAVDRATRRQEVAPTPGFFVV